jgi:hypothetical protein
MNELDELDQALELAGRRRDRAGMDTPEGQEFAAEARELARRILTMRANLPQLDAVDRSAAALTREHRHYVGNAEARRQEWWRACIGFGLVGALVLLPAIGFRWSYPPVYLLAAGLLALSALSFAAAGRAQRRVAELEAEKTARMNRLTEHREALTGAQSTVRHLPSSRTHITEQLRRI